MPSAPGKKGPLRGEGRGLANVLYAKGSTQGKNRDGQEWPTDRLSGCKKFKDLAAKERAVKI
jgi:hypothetical protein